MIMNRLSKGPYDVPFVPIPGFRYNRGIRFGFGSTKILPVIRDPRIQDASFPSIFRLVLPSNGETFITFILLWRDSPMDVRYRSRSGLSVLIRTTIAWSPGCNSARLI